MVPTDSVKAMLKAPSALPLWISNATISVFYTPRAVDNGDVNERADVLAATVPEITAMFAAGFLARPAGSAGPVQISSGKMAVDRVDLQVTGTLHVRALTVLTRLLVNLHDVPGNPDLTIGLPPLKYSSTVRAIQVNCAAAHGAPGETHAHLLDPIVEDALPFPQISEAARPSIQQVIDAERLVVSNIRSLPDDVENAFLTLCDFGCFLPLGAETDFDPGDAELFTHEGALIVDRLPIEPQFLADFIGVLTAGQPMQTTLTLHQ